LVRPLAIEALILSAAGAGLAALIGWMTFDALLRQIPRVAYGMAPVGVSGRVVVASFAMGALAATLFGLAPAWRAANVDVLELHRRRQSVPRRWWNAGAPMVAAQVGIALAVAFGAAVAARTFAAVLRTPLGFSPERVALVSVVAPPRPKAGQTKSADAQAYYERVVTALRASPAVVAVGAIGTLPFSRSAPAAVTRPFGSQKGHAGIVYVLPGYFEAAGIAPVRGRLLTPDDARSDPDAAVVSELAARTLFDRGEPIGGEFENSQGRRFHVVGVVGDVRNSFNRQAEPQAYVIPGPDLRSGLMVVASLRDEQARSRDAVTEALRDLTPKPPVVDWWSNQIGAALEVRDPRFQLIVLGTLASVALGLTALGVFGIVAYAVSARTREMGVRLAIGASPGVLVRLVVRQALPPLAFGVGLGLVLVWLGRGLAEAQFYKVNARDPLALACATGAIVAAAVLAAYIPARRAATINPVDVLRSD
jgi:putative ABC transport system permease protein